MEHINSLALSNKHIADFLLVTATDTETEILHAAMQPVCKKGLLEINVQGRIYFAGIFGGYNILHCQCSNMGTQERGSSILTVSSALKDWSCIQAVIMLGVAFGMYENEGNTQQHFSDVLIAKSIFPYENQRLNPDGTTDYRGTEHASTKNFLDAFSVISREWNRNNLYGQTTNVEICSLLSGEKLLDNLDRRDELKREFLGYRGGEMEGIGIASACESQNKPWILLKSICDFADGNKSSDKKEKQKDAAMAAVEACKCALQTVNVKELVGEKTTFWYSSLNVDYNKVFFIHYDNDCEPYYLIRSVDNNLKPFFMTKNCWVYGNTGMGKSELLTRTLVYNNVNYIYVDLVLCSKTDVADTFSVIYDTICETVEIERKNIFDFEDYVKAITEVLNDYYNCEKIYLLIDEIPYEHKSEMFCEFVDKFCSMIQYFNRYVSNKKVYFMLSSISSPLDSLDSITQQRIQQHIKFLELDNWTLEECRSLIKILCESADVQIEDETLFAEKFNRSPRLIKNALKESCSLGYRTIDNEILNKLSNC